MPAPIYTSENCAPAYQLRWSVALFGRQSIPSPDAWRSALAQVLEPDGIRLLECELRDANVCSLLVSTKPSVAPSQIVKRVKGRLQHLLKRHDPELFRRNFSIVSVGDAKRIAVEEYVARQLGHHPAADPRVQSQLAGFQASFPQTRLCEPFFSAHGRYLCNLHLVRREEPCRGPSLGNPRSTHATDRRERAEKRSHRLSEIGLLPDHLHLAMGIGIDESPQDVALAYLNNLAFAHGMKPIYECGYYVSTFGEYDMGAVRSALRRRIVRSTDARSVEARPTHVRLSSRQS